ncbi:hypothetical protein CHUAL_004490 [Chamberlinius hualienensis]
MAKLFVLIPIVLVNIVSLVVTQNPIVEIAEGQLQGKTGESVFGRPYSAFLSIPFAQPPVGDLRFKAPTPSSSWTGILDATTDPPLCAQSLGGPSATGQDDCLYLNVYSPQLPDETSNPNFPVIVFIYGGEFSLGGDQSYYYGPERYMDKDVVLVNINYRLGPFGFLSTADPESPGNYGLLDQVQALKWVQKNIAAFGGNPNQVTIQGESAGSASVSYLFLSPAASGLFHGAIGESGSALCSWSLQKYPLDYATQLAQGVNCSTASTTEIVECLRSKTVDEIVEAAWALGGYDLIRQPFLPVVEDPSYGQFLTEWPLNILNAGTFNQVPVLTGYAPEIYNLSNPEFYSVVLPTMMYMAYKVRTDFDRYVNLSLAVKEQYFVNVDVNDQLAVNRAVIDMETDAIFLAQNDLYVRKLAEYVPVYTYIFAFPGASASSYSGEPEISHAEELPYFFKFIGQEFLFDDDDLALSVVMLEMWTNFATYSNPTPSGYQIQWEASTPTETRYLYIYNDTQTTTVPNYRRVLKFKEVGGVSVKSLKDFCRPGREDPKVLKLVNKLVVDPRKLMETRSTNALFKRAEQLKRWEESETNKECSVLKDKPRKINFTDECVFLAACSAGDKDEVKRLLLKGANIDTANVDGLTALHQSCIDDNLDMVEFLVEHGADVNCGDNEGWTPLHATASCGFVSIAKYLIENGADVTAVNNDGELPLDIAEQDEMEELLQDELDKLGIDCDYARSIEEHMMLEDANRMLNDSIRVDERHSKTGATAMHVSAAKNYTKVLRILLQAGSDINAQDFDGWTAFHAAAHWGQKEACKLLSEHLSLDMEIENYAGQTAFDVADSEIVSYLEELKAKQLAMKDELKKKVELESFIENKVLPSRVSSKLGVSAKSNAINRDRGWDRATNDYEELTRRDKSFVNASSDNESTESSSDDLEIEKKNDVNKVTTAIEANTVKHNLSQGEQIMNKVSPVKDQQKENDMVASTELPKVVRKEEPAKTEMENNVTEFVIKAVPPVVPTPSLTINLARESNTTASNAQLSASVPTTPTSTNSQVRRSFVPPVRDEESETQRKAHAKRVRETRRSTQGVTLEDLKGAEQLVQKKSQESEEKNNVNESNKEESRTMPKNDASNDRDSMVSVERRPSWRIRMARDEIKPVVDSQNLKWSSESPEEPSVTATVTLSNPVNLENSSIPVYSRRARAPVINSIAASSDVDTTVTVTLKSPVSPTHNEDDYSKDNDKDNDKENENKTALSIQSNPSAIQRRRRPKRRSTGVVQIDLEDGDSEKSDGNLKREDHVGAMEAIEDQAIADKGYRSSRYGSTSSLSDVGSRGGDTASKTSNRSSRAGSVGSSVSVNDTSEIDYKKLYEEQKVENERLAEKQKQMEKDLESAKLLLDKATVVNQRNASSDADRREKRALERKLSEMEEELKQFELLKAENQRLRDENGALIRVISKLSKTIHC